MSETDPWVKMALRHAAGQRMHAGRYGISPCPTEPRINRRHIDGPYLSALDGQIRWLSLWERLLTKLGIWNAWDIEWRRFPLPASVGRNAERQDPQGLGPKDEHA